jgi:hypothetical protein
MTFLSTVYLVFLFHRQCAFTLTGSSTVRPIKRQTGHLQNYEQQFGYKESSETPGRVVYRVGGYYPGGSGYYPASAKGGNPGDGGKSQYVTLHDRDMQPCFLV